MHEAGSAAAGTASGIGFYTDRHDAAVPTQPPRRLSTRPPGRTAQGIHAGAARPVRPAGRPAPNGTGWRRSHPPRPPAADAAAVPSAVGAARPARPRRHPEAPAAWPPTATVHPDTSRTSSRRSTCTARRQRRHTARKAVRPRPANATAYSTAPATAAAAAVALVASLQHLDQRRAWPAPRRAVRRVPPSRWAAAGRRRQATPPCHSILRFSSSRSTTCIMAVSYHSGPEPWAATLEREMENKYRTKPGAESARNDKDVTGPVPSSAADNKTHIVLR